MELLIDHHAQEQFSVFSKTLNYFRIIHAISSVDSTNNYLLKLEKSNAPGGSVVIAKNQTDGKGRLNREWCSGEGNIALSLLVRPPFLPKDVALLSMAPAVAMVKALNEFNVSAVIKWPNDIMIDRPELSYLSYAGHYRKIGGILVENVFEKNLHKAAVLGLGLNVVKSPNHVTYAAALNRNLCRIEISKVFLIFFDEILSDINSPKCETIKQYKKHCITLGKKISFYKDGIRVTKTAIDIANNGALLVEENGKVDPLWAGDIFS